MWEQGHLLRWRGTSPAHSTERGVACTPLRVTASPVSNVTRNQGQPGLWGIKLRGSALGQAFEGGPLRASPVSGIRVPMNRDVEILS